MADIESGMSNLKINHQKSVEKYNNSYQNDQKSYQMQHYEELIEGQ